MTDMKKVNNQDLPLQAKVFTRWVSNELKDIPNSNVTDITKDLSNGVVLIELAQVLTHKKAPRDWVHQPTTEEQNDKNCKIALKMFGNNGLKTFGITSKGISQNNEEQIISLVWQLISHYSIINSFGNLNNPKENVTEKNIDSKLLSWAMKKTQNYKNVFAFKPYDLAMCALLDSYYPNKIKYYVLDLKDHQKNFKLIIDVMEELGIPCLIYPEDISKNNNQVDQKALLAQLSIVRNFLEVKPHTRELKHSDSVIQKKFDSQLINNSTPEKIAIRNAEKNLIINQEKLLHAQIQAKRKEKSELKTKKEKENLPVVSNNNKNKNYIRNNKKLLRSNLRPNSKINKKEEIKPKKQEQSPKQSPKPISVDDQNKEMEDKIVDDQIRIEREISEEFKENIKAFNERKQEEMKEENQIINEQENIARRNSNEFDAIKESIDAFDNTTLLEKEVKIKSQAKKQSSNKPKQIQNPMKPEIKLINNNNNNNNTKSIEKQISEEFKVNTENFNERKQEENEAKMNDTIQTENEKRKIEQQILEEFKENQKAFNERKQEERIEEEKQKQPTKEQLQIEKQLSEEFKENREAFNERKQEEKIEHEKQERIDEPIERQISEEFRENVEAFNERKQEEKIEKEKENRPTKEQLQIQKDISEVFKENKEAFNERKQEEKIEEAKIERIDEPIEKEISKEFRENVEAFNERKQEEKIEQAKEKQPTKEQLQIQKEISEEFKENIEAHEKRKEEDKIEKEKLKREEEEKEGIKYNIDNRPEWKP